MEELVGFEPTATTIYHTLQESSAELSYNSKIIRGLRGEFHHLATLEEKLSSTS